MTPRDRAPTPPPVSVSSSGLTTEPPLPPTIGRYRVGERLGNGAMAAVHVGFDLDTDEQVALKVLHGRRAQDEVFFERLRREAQAMATIDHPNVVRVLGFGISDDGIPYMATELVRGCTLQQLLSAEGKLTPLRAARIAVGIARGLAASHEQCFIHRDLKPSNVMLTTEPAIDTAKILDFGIVGFLHEATDRLTQDGVLLGTPAYMAPEQVLSPEVTAKADMYALGCIMYELLCGHPPFEGGFREVAVRQLVLAAPALPPADGLEKLVAALMEKDPNHRPAALEVVRQLEAFLSDLAPTVVRVARPRSTTALRRARPEGARDGAPQVRTSYRRPWAIAMAASAALVMAGASYSYGPRMPRFGVEPLSATSIERPVDSAMLTSGTGGAAASDEAASPALLSRVEAELGRAVQRRVGRVIPVVGADISDAAVTGDHLRATLVEAERGFHLDVQLLDGADQVIGRAAIGLRGTPGRADWNRSLDQVAQALFPVVVEHKPTQVVQQVAPPELQLQ